MDVADLIPRWTSGAEEGNNIAVGILELFKMCELRAINKITGGKYSPGYLGS